jgi:mono/diheme cytochrome c family protein
MNQDHKNKGNDPFKIILVFIFLAMTLGSFTHCVIEPPKQATNKKNSRSTASSENNENSQNQNSDDGNNNVGIPTPVPTAIPTTNAGEEFFNQNVLVNFQNNCMVCHAAPAANPPLPGPLTIYNYDQMRVKLLNGTSGTDNELIRKMQGIIGHAGGDRCPGGNTDTVCQNVIDWYGLEATPSTPSPTPTPDPVTGGTGAISVVSPMGKITGYAADPADPGKTIGVNFYLDGPSGAGTLMNQSPIQANLAGFNGGVAGTHAFNYYIPILYRDGMPHTVHAYGVDGNDEYLLQGTPYSFTAYTSTIEGFNYYNGTVKPMLDQSCSACHAFSYDQNFSSLLTPSPANGGTMDNNEMVNMPSGGSMGTNHPGGNICGSKNNSPCAEIQTWWDLEFN